jgi:hypothetical protein
MTLNASLCPFDQFFGLDGNPLENGYVYIGVVGLDPVANPVPIFYDASLTIPAPNPMRTIAGYVSNAGTPANVFTSGNYSIKVADKNNVQTYYVSDFLLTTNFSDLRSDLAAQSGSSLVGFIQSGVGAVATTLQSDSRQTVRVSQFGVIGSGDETIKIQKAIDYCATFGGYNPSVGSTPSGPVSNAPVLDFGNLKCTISDQLVCPPYFSVIGRGAVITQTNSAKDIFRGDDAYLWDIKGIHFIGGRHHAYLQNNNVDRTQWFFDMCTFGVSSDFAVKTFPTGGASSHLSAILTIKNGAFYYPKQAVLNYCDSCIIDNCWVFVGKSNFSANSAVFVNGSVGNGSLPVMHLTNMFGVPLMGDQGVDRLANVRWIDHNDGSIIVEQCRFGGEQAGMPIVYTFAIPSTVTPFIATSISIEDSNLSCGNSAANDSGVVILNGQIPRRISIRDNNGPNNSPYIVNYNNGIANFATYYSTWQTASGVKAWSQFHIDIDGNAALNPAGVIYNQPIPLGMRPYIDKSKRTLIKRSANQTITNGFAVNILSLDTLSFDNQGGFDMANPDRILMPYGATTMNLSVNLFIVAFTVGTLEFRVLNSAGVIQWMTSQSTNANPSSQAITLNCDLDAGSVANEFYRIDIRCNTVANMQATAYVTTRALDAVL